MYVGRENNVHLAETAFHGFHPWPIIHANENYGNECGSAEIMCDIFALVRTLYLRNIWIIINHRDYCMIINTALWVNHSDIYTRCFKTVYNVCDLLHLGPPAGKGSRIN